MKQENESVDHLIMLSALFAGWDVFFENLFNSATDGSDFMRQFKRRTVEDYAFYSGRIEKGYEDTNTTLTIKVLDVMFSVIDAIDESLPILDNCNTKAYVYKIARAYVSANSCLLSTQIAVNNLANLFDEGETFYDNRFEV
ncbi:hypothetical protein NWUPM3A1_33 [Escherichia phage vB_EcoM_3A1_SA_NWU]|uniref:Uncharacterized protein n=3 Tax=Phapecoctavirus TaxID=2733124 RepID=A0A6B9WLJ7_9CAUD|nr:hypothetical protein [Escherichia coli]YP_009803553.1 hypothetical protein HOT48_gp260 [Klebsiella phage ZCKP1]YP_009986771.1 hypothetical protein JR326_gp115 [Escherichia phage ukendt]UJQ43743.1 hypothetical protein [Escherichia phage dw-ec]UKM17204.1 hypothetical protein [Escherichia phage SKA64]UPW38731.1 hypothetical protein ESCO37_00219 [Escherichia phage vB_EcoM_ESCO37]UPW40147.1 hypothetical protein REC_00109 [Escherichia phage vB_EcoM_REC]WAX24633.1 hypothetical protein [Escherich